jgi:hypothetical protein
VRSGATVRRFSERAVRSDAKVRRFSAWRGAVVQRFAASDAAPSPDAVAAEPDGKPVRRAAPLPEVAPLPEALRAAPLPEAVRVAPWRGVARGGPRPRAVRAFCPGPTSPRSPRPPRRR